MPDLLHPLSFAGKWLGILAQVSAAAVLHKAA
jgi:hypothetical protein